MRTEVDEDNFSEDERQRIFDHIKGKTVREQGLFIELVESLRLGLVEKGVDAVEFGNCS